MDHIFGKMKVDINKHKNRQHGGEIPRKVEISSERIWLRKAEKFSGISYPGLDKRTQKEILSKEIETEKLQLEKTKVE